MYIEPKKYAKVKFILKKYELIHIYSSNDFVIFFVKIVLMKPLSVMHFTGFLMEK